MFIMWYNVLELRGIVVIIVGEHSNFKRIPTHTQDHGDA